MGTTDSRRLAVLAWVPRISAPLSFFGSLFIMYDILKYRKNRESTQHQLLLHMSFIDSMSSVAWALSTAPIPVTDENGEPSNVYGARGNQKTCTAQGFFIQLGLTSPFYNLALAVYYMLVIFYGWSEDRIDKKARFWMYTIPIMVGLGLALGGIPLYEPDLSMCYIARGDNARNQLIFLVIPITTVIVFATLIMFKIYLKVYYQERVSHRWVMTRRQDVSSLSSKVFWQAFWYLMCFYVTWPVLVVITFIDDSFYNAFGLLCMAMLVAPSQGFLNFINYSRPHVRRWWKKRKLCSCFRTKLEGKHKRTLERDDELQSSEKDNEFAVSVVALPVAGKVGDETVNPDGAIPPSGSMCCENDINPTVPVSGPTA